MSVSIGDVIRIKPLHVENEDPSGILRTASTYQYGFSLVLSPNENKEYVVCKGNASDGFLLAQRNDYDVPIGFALVYRDGQPHFVVTQVGFELKPVEVSVTGKVSLEEIPDVYPIGSQVFLVHESQSPLLLNSRNPEGSSTFDCGMLLHNIA